MYYLPKFDGCQVFYPRWSRYFYRAARAERRRSGKTWKYKQWLWMAVIERQDESREQVALPAHRANGGFGFHPKSLVEISSSRVWLRWLRGARTKRKV